MQHLSREELLRILGRAAENSQRDHVMMLLAFCHGLRASEVVGQYERQHGLYETRERAELKAAGVAGSLVEEVSRLRKKKILRCFAVMTPKKVLTGGLYPQDFSDGMIVVQRLKGSRRTSQPLLEDPDSLLNERTAVDAWLAKHRELHGAKADDERLFPITRQQFYRAFRNYGKLAGIPATRCHPHILKHTIGKQLIRQLGIDYVQGWLGHKEISSTGRYLGADEDEVANAVVEAMKRTSGKK